MDCYVGRLAYFLTNLFAPSVSKHVTFNSQTSLPVLSLSFPFASSPPPPPPHTHTLSSTSTLLKFKKSYKRLTQFLSFYSSISLSGQKEVIRCEQQEEQTQQQEQRHQDPGDRRAPLASRRSWTPRQMHVQRRRLWATHAAPGRHVGRLDDLLRPRQGRRHPLRPGAHRLCRQLRQRLQSFLLQHPRHLRHLRLPHVTPGVKGECAGVCEQPPRGSTVGG